MQRNDSCKAVAPGDPREDRVRFDIAGYLEELSELVAIDTISPMPAEAKHKVGAFLGRYGAVRPSEDALWLRHVPGARLWVYVHVDTKPVHGTWRSNPFSMMRQDDLLFARGVSDSKFQLLNALHLFTDLSVNILIDGGEEIGAAAAAAYLRSHSVDRLVLVDGATHRIGQIYAGISGQFDGEIVLTTNTSPAHPGRAVRRVAFDMLAKLLADADGLHFNLTKLQGGDPHRSLTLEEIVVGFDLRFRPDERVAALGFLNRPGITLRQHYPPLQGRLTAGRYPIAHFSNPLGCGLEELSELWVVPGGRPDNNAHCPNEWISIDQICLHRAALYRLIDTELGL